MFPEFYPTLQVPKISQNEYQLYVAAKAGNTSMAKGIIAANSELCLDAFFKDAPNNCHTILHAASLSGSTKTVKLLINAGCSINLTNSTNKTALDLAILEGLEDMAWLLTTKGAKIVASNPFNYKYINHVITFKDTRLLAHLLDQCPDLNRPADTDSPFFTLPLTVTVMYGKTEALKVVAMHPSVKLVNIYKTFNILSFIIVNTRSCYGKLKLIMDCIRQRYGQDELTKELNRPSNISGVSTDPLCTPINLVCCQRLRATSSSRLNLIRLLTSNGADLNWVRNRNTASHVRAVKTNSYEMGAISPLMECIKMGDLVSCKFLVLHGARATPQEALHFGLETSNDLWLFKMMVAAEESLEISSMPPIEEISFKSEEAKQTYDQWTRQVKSLQHLIRAKWLKLKCDQATKEQVVDKAHIPRILKEYLLLKRPLKDL